MSDYNPYENHAKLFEREAALWETIYDAACELPHRETMRLAKDKMDSAKQRLSSARRQEQEHLKTLGGTNDSSPVVDSDKQPAISETPDGR